MTHDHLYYYYIAYYYFYRDPFLSVELEEMAQLLKSAVLVSES